MAKNLSIWQPYRRSTATSTTSSPEVPGESTPTLLETAETLLALSAKKPSAAAASAASAQLEEMMRRTDTAVVFPQPHPDSTTAAVLKKASKGKAKKLRAKGRWFKATSNLPT